MKLTLALLLVFGTPLAILAGTTIDANNSYAYGANLGWMNWRGDINNGAIIGDYVCSGYVYSANVGWINLGNGTPTNGIYYQNLSANDFGINQDGLGNLRGYAYGANIGWINFETNGAPRVDLLTGYLSGYAWSANCGWINLSNLVASVQTDTLQPGTPAPNGLPIPWLLANFGTTNVNANADPTGKGFTIAQDYVAGTNPNDATDYLQITSQNFVSDGTSVTITWASSPTRVYSIQKSSDLTSSDWLDSGLGLISPGGGTTSRTFTDTPASARFYRVNVMLPLSP